MGNTNKTGNFLGMLLDCLDDQIAVLDITGKIIYVNNAWIRFGIENGQPVSFDWIGTNYLKACNTSAVGGDVDAQKAYDGIRRVLSGEVENFYHEYPCHSPTEQRWFLMRIVPLNGADERFFVISHVNITQRKLIEEQVEAQSLLDPLTGLANRRHFDRFLHEEWQRNMREQTPVSLVLLDLDHFKSYNDTHGHVAGDEYLRQAGTVIGQHARRPSDLAARYGGEEFVLILGNTDLAGATAAAKSMLAGISGLRASLDCGDYVTSASAGVTCTVPSQSGREGVLVDLADQALYRAKDSGRNRVVSHACFLDLAERERHCRTRPCHPGG